MATMQAWQATSYGDGGNPADVIDNKLSLQTVPMPVPKAGQVVVKIEVAAVNPIDWKLFSGGLDGICPCSFPYAPGFDIAGTVHALGEGVTSLAVDDKVVADIGLVESCKKDTDFGPCGAFAQYAALPADLVSKRGDLAADVIAGLPLAGMTSYQALFTGEAKSFAGEDLGKLESGQKVLILGGSSATGAYGIQLAKNAGAYVATTASTNKMSDGTSKMDFVKQMGADEVINYKEQDWSELLAGKEYDMIYDNVGDDADWPKAAKVLKKGGEFISIANFNGPTSTDDHKFKVFLIKSCATDLDKLVAMVKADKLQCPVDSVVAFSEVPAALKKSMAFASAGKILIKIDH